MNKILMSITVLSLLAGCASMNSVPITSDRLPETVDVLPTPSPVTNWKSGEFVDTRVPGERDPLVGDFIDTRVPGEDGRVDPRDTRVPGENGRPL